MACQCIECVKDSEPEPNRADRRAVIVDAQGVQFGTHCWVSHEKITGYAADQLNAGTTGIIGAQYMEWVRGESVIAPMAFSERCQEMTETLWTMSPSERGAIIAALTTAHIQMCAADMVTKLTGAA